MYKRPDIMTCLALLYALGFSFPIESNNWVDDKALKGIDTLCLIPWLYAAIKSFSRTDSAVSAVHADTSLQFLTTQLSPVLTCKSFNTSSSGKL